MSQEEKLEKEEELEKQMNDTKEKSSLDNETNRVENEQKSDLLEESFKLQLQRLQAEFINYKRRSEKERFETATWVKSEFVKRFIPIMDDMQRVRENIDAEPTVLKEAIEMVLGKLEKFMHDEKIIRFADIGDMFNPDEHEALMQQDVEDENKDNSILNVFEKGYKIESKIIRHAKVQVAKFNR